jgi:3-oxoacyl-[acyl-carrier protein] reductase
LTPPPGRGLLAGKVVVVTAAASTGIGSAIARRCGVIVNNASVLGWRAQAGQAHYAAAKAGVMAFGRAAEPWEVAAVVAFLASDYASYLIGEVVSVSSQHP